MSGGRGEVDRHGRPQLPRARVNDVENRLNNAIQYGVVEEVDHAKSRARVRFSETRVGQWMPWATGNADPGMVNSNPLQVGAQVAVLSPNGDQAQGFIMPGIYRSQNARFATDGDTYGSKFADGTTIAFNKATSTYDVNIPSGSINLTTGGASLKQTDDGFLLTAGGVTFAFTGAGFVQTGGKQEHDGKDVGATHIHSGVLKGGDKTGTPA